VDLRTVIFYGKAGAGKGTQARLLKEVVEKRDTEHPVLYVETGAMFRDFAKQSNFTAQIVKKVLAEGGLLPEFLPVWVWTDIFIKYVTESEHIILDGLARNSDEVPVLARALEFYKRPSVDVVVLHVSEEEAMNRLKERARGDDNDAEIKKRLAWYDQNVTPAINRWRDFSSVRVHDIDAGGTIEEGHQRVLEALKFS
jgi:adenylate kinase